MADMKNVTRNPLGIALLGSVLGLAFATHSTLDYIEHLDRGIHAMHCSFIPGMPEAADVDNPCRAAMYSAYSALFRQNWWGGVPISLLALGVYAFFFGWCIALLAGGLKCSRLAYRFFGLVSLGPLLVSVVMAAISAIKLGTFCKTCVGLYGASALLAVGALWAMQRARRLAAFVSLTPDTSTSADHPNDPVAQPLLPQVSQGWVGVWVVLLVFAVFVPAWGYVASLPDYRPKLLGCGKLAEPTDATRSMIKLATAHPKRAAIVFADPLCPACKAIHERLIAEGAIENLDLSVVPFPLDNTCNWMVDRAVHPGGCLLSRVVLCAEPRSRDALEWIFDHQEELASLGKSGEPLLRARVRERFGPEIDSCADAKSTKVRLNNGLHYAVTNRVPVSTPQIYLGDQRICDEDTDLGLRYTLGQLAPEVLR